jgi:hypothetical protein
MTADPRRFARIPPGTAPVEKDPCTADRCMPGVCRNHRLLYLDCLGRGRLIATGAHDEPWPEYLAGWTDCPDA